MASLCPPGTQGYTIQAGDTFYDLAENFNLTIEDIISANPGVNPNKLQIGQLICLPLQKKPPSCPEGNYYTVKENDTAEGIAESFSISLDDLKEGNPGTDLDLLEIGQVICIPLATPPTICSANISTYIIQKGDTFYHLAQKFNLTVEDLLQANPSLNPNLLLIGQPICIPVPER